jgi:hypothetical protein
MEVGFYDSFGSSDSFGRVDFGTLWCFASKVSDLYLSYWAEMFCCCR